MRCPNADQGSCLLPVVTQKECDAKKQSHWLHSLDLAETALSGFNASLKMDGSNGIR